MYGLEKIRTSFKDGNGINDYYISPELKEKELVELNKKINIIGVHYHNNNILGMQPTVEEIRLLSPLRFTYFTNDNAAVFIQSTYIGIDHTKRYNNYLNHTLVFLDIQDFYNPIQYLFSPSMMRTVPEERNSYASKILWNNFQKNYKDTDASLKYNATKEQLITILALLIESKIDEKPLVLLGNVKQCTTTLKQLFNLLPPQLAKNISFSTLTFSKLDKKNSLLDINCYTDYSFKLGHIPSYQNAKEVINDAQRYSYNYFNLNTNLDNRTLKYTSISNYLTQSNETLEYFLKFCEKFTINIENLPFMVKLHTYIGLNKSIPADELKDIIYFYFNHTTFENSCNFINNHIDFNVIKTSTALYIEIFTFLHPKISTNILVLKKIENVMLENFFSCLVQKETTKEDLMSKIKLIEQTVGEQKLINYFSTNFNNISKIMQNTSLDILILLDTNLILLAKKYFKEIPNTYFDILAYKIQSKPQLIGEKLRFYNNLDFKYVLSFLNALSINENEKVFIKAIIEEKSDLEKFINNFLSNEMYDPVIKIYLYQMAQTNQNIFSTKVSSRYAFFIDFFQRVKNTNIVGNFVNTCLQEFKEDGNFLNHLFHNKDIHDKLNIFISIDTFLKKDYQKNKKYIKIPSDFIHSTKYLYIMALSIENRIHANQSGSFNSIIKEIDYIPNKSIQEMLMKRIELKKKPPSLIESFIGLFGGKN